MDSQLKDGSLSGMDEDDPEDRVFALALALMAVALAVLILAGVATLFYGPG